MKRLDDDSLTPLYLKRSPDDAWPDDPAFYAMTGDGLFLCRNDPFFRSAVAARRPPSELPPQREFLEISCPRIPRHLLEQAVGFFDWAYRVRGAESVLLVGWNEARQAVELLAPEQTAYSFCSSRGEVFAESVRYLLPHPLPSGLVIYGDLHSHCDMDAYASSTDVRDDAQFNGLHLVAGRLDDEPPRWHLEATVDGARFTVRRELVFEDYVSRRTDFPAEWRARHRVEYSGHLAPAVGSSAAKRGPLTDIDARGPNGDGPLSIDA